MTGLRRAAGSENDRGAGPDSDEGPEVLIVGAGIAGVSAARRLLELGRSVQIVERAATPGGRMATERGERANFDHGAQFFTVRGQELTAVVERAEGAGAVVTWTHGFDDPPDGYPRYRGAHSMGDLVAWMIDDAGLSVVWSTDVVNLTAHPARSYLVTAPVPEALALLSFSDLLPRPQLHHELAKVAYKPTISVLLELDQPPVGFPHHGGIQHLDDPSLAFVTDNQRKGISDAPAITVHLTNELSAEMWNDDDVSVLDHTIELVRDLLAGTEIVQSDVHRWRYAGPVEVWPDRTVIWGQAPVVALAGEAFGGPKVEGAFLSGLAAADAVHEGLNQSATLAS